MNVLAERLKQRLVAGAPMLADGAMGSRLIECGVPPEATLHANRDHSDLVRSIHREYIDAGCEILTANTFGTAHDNWSDLIASGLRIAWEEYRQACASRLAGILCSLPPATLLGHAAELAGIAANEPAWPNGLVIETCVNLDEAIAAVRAAKVIDPSLLAITFHPEAGGRLRSGEPLSRAVEAVAKEGVDATGINCGGAPEAFPKYLAEMRCAANIPIIARPSAGVPNRSSSGRWSYPLNAPQFAEIGEQLLRAGATVVGGCCGAHEPAIRELARRCFR
ncbi:MAG TPA: homocysteine S-methyltransferase family protein [Chthonomonadales bacterium]|nr:homocysteine S-methyltransferase family protein [Chthonomonadales bacterium]